MRLLWIVQLLWDAMVLSGLVYWWLFKRSPDTSITDAKMESTLSAVEAQLEASEAELKRQREHMQDQLKRLSRICDEASQILERNRWVADATSLSSEEMELRAVAAGKPAEQNVSEKIPTLTELEHTRNRLKAEVSVDLRTLLQEQLA